MSNTLTRMGWADAVVGVALLWGASCSSDPRGAEQAEPELVTEGDPQEEPEASAASVPLPYTLRFVEKTYPAGSSPPALQSFVTAPAPNGKVLVVCGRTDQGMHGFGNGLPDKDGNPPPSNFQSFTQHLYVLDLGTGASTTFDLSQLPAELADPLRSTNAQGFYDAASDRLYVVGGYGIDSATNTKVTFDTITAFNVSDMATAILAKPQSPDTIAGLMTRASDDRFEVTGGGLAKLGNRYFLVFGQAFTGEYVFAGPHNFTQKYTEEVRVFTLDESTLEIIAYAPVNSQDPTSPFHRRDVNIRPAIDPATGKERIGVYAGVFPPGQLAAFTKPVYIGADSSAFVDEGFDQSVNMYECATVPIYDGAKKVMYQTFFGGITGSDPKPIDSVKSNSDGLPWTNLISTVVFDPSASPPYRELVLPGKALSKDTYVGGEAEFLVEPALVTAKQATDSGIVLFDTLDAKNSTLLGHIYGGIETSGPAPAPSKDGKGGSKSSKRVFEVWLDPVPGSGVPPRPK